MHKTVRTVQRQCSGGLLRAELEHANGGQTFRIRLSSLPANAQRRYWKQQCPALSPTLTPAQPTAAEALAAREAFERLPLSRQAEAERRFEIMAELNRLESAMPMMERYRLISDQFGESAQTLRRWRNRVRHLADRRDWVPALAPSHGGGPTKAELHPDVWKFVVYEWGTQSKPSMRFVYRRALVFACEKGFAIPSYATVKRRIEAIPTPQKVFLRNGNAALDQLFPSIQRDYSDLRLHERWCSDGRTADVFCRWSDGTVARPVVMAWEDLRSRKVLGWAVAKTESAALVRQSFQDAAWRSGVIPENIYVDNGKAYKSIQVSGGQEKRNRYKVKRDEPDGIFSLLKINMIFAQPHHGQSKPIESWWNTPAQAEKLRAFAGAYCGNRPENKPEEFSESKAIPIAAYIQYLQNEIEAKNARSHRGDSMDGRSPNEVYAELSKTAILRHPTQKQLHLCLLKVKVRQLDKSHGVTINKNRYWSEALAQLPHRGPYTFRYDPEDASESLFVYDGARFVCEAPLLYKTGFCDERAAKDHISAKKRMVRAEKDKAAAFQDMGRAEESWHRKLPTVSEPPTSPRPVPKVPKLVPLKRTLPLRQLPTPRVEEDAESVHQLREARARRQEDQLKRLVNGG